MYTHGKRQKRVLLGMYVNDLIVIGADQGEVNAYKEEMKHSFKMNDLGCLNYYPGIKIKQQPGRITLLQVAYTAKLLEKAGMTDYNIVQVPMKNCLKLSKQSTTPLVDASYYRSIVASLRYLVHTRSDIGFTFGYVS